MAALAQYCKTQKLQLVNALVGGKDHPVIRRFRRTLAGIHHCLITLFLHFLESKKIIFQWTLHDSLLQGG